MIYSRTATKQDIITLEIQELINKYSYIPKHHDKWDGALYKFWDYALILHLLKDKRKRILNIVHKEDDITFNVICKEYGHLYRYIDVENLLRLPIRMNKYDVVTCLGSLEHTVGRVSNYLHKIHRHVALNGYLIITTDEQNISKYKNKTIVVSDLLDFSLMLEQFGFEFISDHANIMVDYNENELHVPHSLVMKRVGQ